MTNTCACLLFFAVCSVATSTANTARELMWMRFATGLGLGGVVPNALALTADFMPKRFRVTLVLLAWFGFSIGSGIAGPITARILDGYSWRIVFLFGGVLPVLLVPLLRPAVVSSIRPASSACGRDPSRFLMPRAKLPS